MPAPELYERTRAALGALVEKLGRGSVSDAHGLAVIEAVPPAKDRPVLYLLPLRETAPGSPFSDSRQTVTVDFAVLIAIDARNVRRGQATDRPQFLGDPEPAVKIDASLQAAEELRAEVIAAVRSLSPGPGPSHTDVQYAGGRLLQIGPGVIWHQLDFRTAYLED